MDSLWTPPGAVLDEKNLSQRILSGRATSSDIRSALSIGAAGQSPNDPTLAEMAKNRRINSKIASGVGNVSFATGRPKDPLFYWKQNNLPYDSTERKHLERIREFCRLLYQTHALVGSCVDIYSKYPLTGMEIRCKDDQLAEFYSELFFDRLDYEEFLIDVGREYWMAGEAWPYGTWNELLGIWEKDELLDPDDIWVIRSPFLAEPRFEMRLPYVIRTILQNREPLWEYQRLLKEYPEFALFMGEEARMAVSNVVLKQIRFKGDTFNPRGVPLLMRAFRPLLQEEMLNAAVDAVADRLYTPLILAKLGASASDLGVDTPWIPTGDDLAEFEANLDAALSADFRVMVNHFAVDITVPLGKEVLPRASEDFDRLDERILQVFGLSKTMLSGASAGQTYAADALNRDLIGQLLTTYQRKIKRFFRDRAAVVAEAQEHFDYEESGGQRKVIYEEVLEIDPESGEQRIVEKPKLLIPELDIKAMSMQDDTTMRGIIEELRASGIPIPMRTRLLNIPIDLNEAREQVIDEQVGLVVDEQERRKRTYTALRDAKLPIPEDLIADFQPVASGAVEEQVAAEPMPADTLGMSEMEQNIRHAAPELAMVVPVGGPEEAGLPAAEEPSSRPPESDEQRSGMPKP